ncbi:MFS transporter [Amycolatopsis sp. NPDC051372]|uniref:MFS transporter n=1 Tax=Amycolatopsis sp. NPDC051372 TaxID=3155669 RepID=UPI003426D589
MNQPITTEPPMRKIAAASLVGTMIEWYDYFIYGTAAALVFGKVFFPALSGVAATLASFATLAVGFFVRPIGAVIFGHFGDRISRKRMLVLSLILMGTGTFLIGLLPTPAAIGAWAPVLLVLLRILQGIGVSGEWGGAVLLAVEHAPAHRRAFYGSFPQIGNAAGLLLATGGFSLISLLPTTSFMSWGWRIPFFFSAVLLAVALYIRLQVVETPAFRKLAQSGRQAKVPVVEMLRDHWRSVLKGLGLRLSCDVQGYVIITFAVSYVAHDLGLSGTVGTVAVAVAAAVAIFTAPLFGKLADRVGRLPVFLGSAVLGIVLAFPFFWLLDSRSADLIIIAFVVMYAVSNIANYSVQSTFLSELFPTRIRYTGTSFTYHATSVVGGGIAPIIATALVSASGGNPWPVAVYLIVVALITIGVLALTKETRFVNLEGDQTTGHSPANPAATRNV